MDSGGDNSVIRARAGWRAGSLSGWERFLLAIPVLMLGLMGPSLAANSEIGQADTVVNQVFRGGLLNRLQAKSDVFQNEQITTRKDSATELRFADGSRLAIGADAELLLDKMVYGGEHPILGGVARVSKGALRFLGGSGKVAMNFETPVMTIGVRGTRFTLLVSPAETEIEVQEGVVELVGVGFSQSLAAPQSAIIRLGALPQLSRPSPAFVQAVQQLVRLVGIPRDQPSSPSQRAGGPSPVVRTEPVADGGRVLGNLLFRADGRIDALDAGQKLRGIYDPVSDQTRDTAGHTVGQGNRLRQLLGLR